MPVERWSDNVVVVHLADDPHLAEELDALQDPAYQEQTHMVLDFGAVHYINSANISRLLQLRKKLAGSNCRLVLCNISTQLWSVFLVTGLDKIFQFSDNVTTALATLQIAQ